MIGGIELGGVGVEPGFERDDLLAHESPDLIDQHLLFCGGLEIHHNPFSSPFKWGGAPKGRRGQEAADVDL